MSVLLLLSIHGCCADGVQTCLWPGYLTSSIGDSLLIPCPFVFVNQCCLDTACCVPIPWSPCPQAPAVVYLLCTTYHLSLWVDTWQNATSRRKGSCCLVVWGYSTSWPERPGFGAWGCLLTSRQTRKQRAGNAGAQLGFSFPPFLFRSWPQSIGWCHLHSGFSFSSNKILSGNTFMAHSQLCIISALGVSLSCQVVNQDQPSFHLTSIGRVLAKSTEPAMRYRVSVYTMARKHKMWLEWYHQRWINWKTQNQTQSCVHVTQQ